MKNEHYKKLAETMAPHEIAVLDIAIEMAASFKRIADGIENLIVAIKRADEEVHHVP